MVRVLLAGKSLQGHGQVVEDDKAVTLNLMDYYRKVPKTATDVQIGLDTAGQPIHADCELADQKLVLIKIDLV